MAMWKHYYGFIDPYTVVYKSRDKILRHSLELENSINEYIDSIQAIEKNIPSDKIINQIQLAYELRDIKDKLEKVREKLKEVDQYHHLIKMASYNR